MRSSEVTKRDLIESAGALFAKQGYAATSVRDITKSANQPLGAINYHFQSKENLYVAVLKNACEEVAISGEVKEQIKRMTPEDGLRAYITAMVENILDAKSESWRKDLIATETLNMNQCNKIVIENFMEPQFQFVSPLLEKILGAGNKSRVLFATFTINTLIAQLGLYGSLTKSFVGFLEEEEAIKYSSVATKNEEAAKFIANWMFQMAIAVK